MTKEKTLTAALASVRILTWLPVLSLRCSLFLSTDIEKYRSCLPTPPTKRNPGERSGFFSLVIMIGVPMRKLYTVRATRLSPFPVSGIARRGTANFRLPPGGRHLRLVPAIVGITQLADGSLLMVRPCLLTYAPYDPFQSLLCSLVVCMRSWITHRF